MNEFLFIVEEAVDGCRRDNVVDKQLTPKPKIGTTSIERSTMQ
jgi:hypothetical protein